MAGWQSRSHWGETRCWAAAARAHVVLVSPHWGQKMTVRPQPHVSSAASALTAAGATLVAGHSAHVFHGVAGLHYARTEVAVGADREMIAARFTRAWSDLGTTVIESNGMLDISLRPRR